MSLIGTVVRVRIIEKQGNYYYAKEVNGNNIVYIQDTEDFEEEELIGNTEKCIITEERNLKFIGFLLSNRKFVNDLKRIDDKLKETEEYSEIEDIYLVERLKINGKVMGLYLIDEGDIAKYYLDTKEIGVYLKKLRSNNIQFKENTIENQIANQIRDVVLSIDLQKKEISLNQEKEKQKHLIEKALGIDEKQIEVTRIATLDLKQKINERNEKEKVKNQLQKQNENKDEKENTIKDVNIKQELKTNAKVTDMKTLGQVLEKSGKMPKVEGKKFTKIGIIESTQRDNLLDQKGDKAKVNTTRYSMVAIANDGSVVPLDISQDYTEGNNPRETNYQVGQNKKIEKDDVLSRFKVGEGTIGIKNGKYGEIKVYHSPRKTIGGKDIEGNKSLDRELETDNVWSIKKDERDLAGEYEDGYRSVEEGYQEARQHEEKNGKIKDDEKLTIEDIDGEKNTKSHVHDNVDFKDLATKWGYYKDGLPNEKKAEELFLEKRKENPKKETKEIIEMVTEELEEEIGHSRDIR